MATCAKCGVTMPEKIHVPISELGGGIKNVRCPRCGYFATYTNPGRVTAVEERRREEDLRRQREDDNRAYKERTVAQKAMLMFSWIYFLVTMCGVAVCAILGMWAAYVQFGKGMHMALVFLGGPFGVIFILCLFSETIKLSVHDYRGKNINPLTSYSSITRKIIAVMILIGWIPALIGLIRFLS
ncbi:MAG: hypothetical protein LBV12_00080 [Puniceicoccales bacterium]|jgi:hypothetical protein|nr:hypothetical protein [Puniceicoccales bacterium]